MNRKISRNLAQYFLYFILYSIIGWIYEVFSRSCDIPVGIFQPGRAFWPILHHLWGRRPYFDLVVFRIKKEKTVYRETTHYAGAGLFRHCDCYYGH